MRKAFAIEDDDGYDPYDGEFDIYNSNFMGGDGGEAITPRRRRAKAHRRKTRSSRKGRRRGFLGIFGRRRRSRPRRRKVSRSRRSVQRRSGRIKYTKNGQPYIILRNGRARFIKGRRR